MSYPFAGNKSKNNVLSMISHGARKLFRRTRLAQLAFPPTSKTLSENRALFESLEPRVLLSADPAAISYSMSSSHDNLEIRVDSVAQQVGNTLASVDVIQLIDLNTGNTTYKAVQRSANVISAAKVTRIVGFRAPSDFGCRRSSSVCG